jgi:hypothetical protein
MKKLFKSYVYCNLSDATKKCSMQLKLQLKNVQYN